MEDLRRMSPGEVKDQVVRLLGNLVKRDTEGPNHYLFEMGLAWVSPATQIEAGGRPARPGRIQRTAPMGTVLGNGQVRSLNESLYQALIIEEQKPTQRDRLELDSDGEVFSLRGRPGDIHQKHYDPPMDPDGMLFGAGMNLDNRRDSAE